MRHDAEYARSSVVYRELRTALGPWCATHGFRREKGSPAGWVRALNQSRDVSFNFRCSPWGSGAGGGNSFNGLFQEAPSAASGVVPDSPNMRQSDLSCCLVQAELDELREIQTVINRRKPRTPEIEAWLHEISGVGEHTREQYSGNERPYGEGDLIYFHYYSLDDVRLLTAFLAPHLPEIVRRFEEHRCVAARGRPL